MAMNAACRRTSWLLLSIFWLADAKSDHEKVELGPAMPGEERYWLKLKYISFSEGSLSPKFDPSTNDYELLIHNQDVESFTMTLKLAKYDLLFLPKIKINEHTTQYTPLNPITDVVYVNEEVGPEDKTLYIKLEDPIGVTRGLFYMPQNPRTNEYRIRVLQPPEFDEVVKINELEADLKETGQLWYELPSHENGAYVKASCNKFSTTLLVNGEPAAADQNVWTDVNVPHVTWMVECLYANERWSKNILSRTYQLHMVHRKDDVALPIVHLLPQDGKCTIQDLDDPETPKGYLCRTTNQNIDMIVTYDTSGAEVFLDKDGEDINVISGIQTQVQLPADEVNWFLKVEGIRTIKVPMHIVVAAQCTDLMCPAGWVPKPALDQGENAVLHLCHGVTCNLEDDSTTCCREAGSPCEDYALDYSCPDGRQIFKHGFCWSTPCQESDKHYCCQAPPQLSGGKAQFDMREGRWAQWFEKQDKQAQKVTSTLGDHVSFAVQMKGGKATSLKEMKVTEEVLKHSIAKAVGSATSEVKVTAQGAKDVKGDPAVNFAVDISSLSGSARTHEIFGTVKGLVKGDKLLTFVKTGLQEKGVEGAAAMKETWKSEVKLRIAPKPQVGVNLVIQISKTADLGSEGNSEELQPEVADAIRKAILATADIPDKEKLQLVFKKVPTTSTGQVPDGDELVTVSGNITLPHGKEGSKEILEAKFRNPDALKPKLNKALETDIKKEEKEAGSHVLGKKKDYKVWDLNLGAVSKSPMGIMEPSMFAAPTSKPSFTKRKALKAWLDLKRTTTSKPTMTGMVQLQGGSGNCVVAPNSRKVGLHNVVAECNSEDHRQAWFFSYITGALQSAFGVCLAADPNGPPPSPGAQQDTSPQVLQRWISFRGPGPTVQSGCTDAWNEKWTYQPNTGLFMLQGSANPGVCLQVSKLSTLEVALCDGKSFAQQFWFNPLPAEKLTQEEVKTAKDVPVFAKPYFDGEVSLKSSDTTYDHFELAKFAQRRATYYLSQGCSPVPTASCGTPAPDMPNVYVGESVLSLGSKLNKLPWLSALSKSQMEGSGMAMCYYDETCHSEKQGTAAALRMWTKGCNAGGKPKCRYCGKGEFGACPKHFSCADGGLHSGRWSEEQHKWCCEHFSIGCKKPYHCIQGLEDWRSWDDQRKNWCCTYQLTACEDECAKTDPATFRENHWQWCNSFGAPEKKDRGPNEFERFAKMLEKMYDKSGAQQVPAEETPFAFHGRVPLVVAAAALLSGAVLTLLAAVVQPAALSRWLPWRRDMSFARLANEPLAAENTEDISLVSA